MVRVEKKNPMDFFIFLLVIVVCVDLFTPYLIWKQVLPAEIRWVSHAALAAILLISLARMLTFNSIPYAFWMIVFISILWSFIAISHKQGIVPTIWGIWLLIQFPIVAIFMYLQHDPSPRLPEYIRGFCLVVLGLELVAQLLQFAFGVGPGDNLSGLFGKNGTGIAAIFDIFVCCVFFGHWIASKRWLGLVIVLSMGMLSSVLGEMKIFPLAITIIGFMAALIYGLKHHAPGKMLLYLALIIVITVSFGSLYNNIVPGAGKVPLQTYITNPTRLLDYLDRTRTYNKEGNIVSDIGRLNALKISWTSLKEDPVTFLFGYGLGTRSESQTLGVAGVALLSGGLGLTVGSSIMVMMQETGIIGLALLAGFWLWILLTLNHDIQAHPASPAIGLRYALLIYSILWPLWLFYSTTWTMRVPMLLYWMILGYVLAESRQPVFKTPLLDQK